MNKERESKFHQSRVAFMIIENEVIFLRNSSMSHFEWYLSLGLPSDKFDEIIRGYYKEGRIIFYKGDFLYDDEVIEVAKCYGDYIRQEVGDADALLFAGVKKGEIGEVWDPVIEIKLRRNLR